MRPYALLMRPRPVSIGGDVMENHEVMRLAQVAFQTATDANHKAAMAEKSVTAHEEICAERYANINDKLKDVKQAQHTAASKIEGVALENRTSIGKLYTAIDALKATANKAAGIDIALRYACLLLGAAGVVWGFLK